MHCEVPDDAERRHNIQPFNSLFEMRRSVTHRHHEARLYLSILYLRCSILCAAKSPQRSATFNSLFEMRRSRQADGRRGGAAFNSLFEMHVYDRLDIIVKPQLSILYLRCRVAPPAIPSPDVGLSILYLRCNDNDDIARRVLIQPSVLSILYLRCGTEPRPQGAVDVLSILYLRCRHS